MNLESGPLGQPGAHFGMFVGGVIVHDQMHIQRGRNGRVDALKKAQKFLVAVPRLTVSEHSPCSNIEGRKQGGGSMADIVMRDAFHVTQAHGQHRLGAAQGLDLRLFIDGQHDGMIRRVQVQTDNVAYLLDEKRIVG